jgi:hypothetical protein
MHGFPLLVRLRLPKDRPQEALELGLEGAPGGVDVLQALAAGDDDAAASEDEHDDGGGLRAVDEAREHAALERALDVVLLVEELEVYAVVLEVHVDVADDVLDLYDGALEVDARDGPAQDGDDLVRGEDAEEEVAAAGEDHFPGGEEEHGAVRVEEADGDGRELLFLKGAVGEDAVDELEVEGEAAAHDLGGADDVVHHDGGVFRSSVGCSVGCSVRAVRGRVVQVDVAGDAVGRHRRVVRHAAAAAHAGEGAGTHVLSSFKKK